MSALCYITAEREECFDGFPEKYICYWDGKEFVYGSLSVKLYEGIKNTTEVKKTLKQTYDNVSNIRLHIWSHKR